jgi:hypothetical protein
MWVDDSDPEDHPFGNRGTRDVFGDQAMTLAAIDRLVHHATIFEMNVESYRRREALERKKGPGPTSFPIQIVALHTLLPERFGRVDGTTHKCRRVEDRK